MEIEILEIEKINMDGSLQPRHELSPFLIDEYAKALRNGTDFPPVIVFRDGEDNLLVDGFHRLFAAKEVGLTEFPVEIHRGSWREALLFSVSANIGHGLRRSHADKRRAVLTLLQDEEWSEFSDNRIAQIAQVSQPFVSKLRYFASYNNYKMERKVTRGAQIHY